MKVIGNNWALKTLMRYVVIFIVDCRRTLTEVAVVVAVAVAGVGLVVAAAVRVPSYMSNIRLGVSNPLRNRSTGHVTNEIGMRPTPSMSRP